MTKTSSCSQRSRSFRLREFLSGRAFDPYGSAASLERFIASSALLIQHLPPPVLAALMRFRSQGNRSGALLLRGLVFDDAAFGPTPSHWSLERQRTPVSSVHMLGHLPVRRLGAEDLVPGVSGALVSEGTDHDSTRALGIEIRCPCTSTKKSTPSRERIATFDTAQNFSFSGSTLMSP